MLGWRISSPPSSLPLHLELFDRLWAEAVTCLTVVVVVTYVQSQPPGEGEIAGLGLTAGGRFVQLLHRKVPPPLLPHTAQPTVQYLPKAKMRLVRKKRWEKRMEMFFPRLKTFSFLSFASLPWEDATAALGKKEENEEQKKTAGGEEQESKGGRGQ